MCAAVLLAACGGTASPATTSTSVAVRTTATTVAAVPPVSVDFDDFELYESAAYGFAIAHPSDWTVTEVGAENLIGFTAPASATGLTPNFNVTVTEVTNGLSPVAYYEGEIDRVRNTLENAEILEVADVNVDGVIGRGLTVVTTQSGTDIGISRIIVIRDNRAYELSFFAEATDLQRLAPLVTAIFQSMRWVG